MKRILAIAAIMILLIGLVPLSSASADAAGEVVGSIQHIPLPEFPQANSRDQAAHFSSQDTKMYLVSGVFDGYAISMMHVQVQANGSLRGEGLFSFVEMFGGRVTGNSFLGRYDVTGSVPPITTSAPAAIGIMRGSITIIAGTGSLEDLSGSLDVTLELRYNPYFYQTLWSGSFIGHLNNMP